MDQLININVLDIVFKKPIVCGNFLLRKVDGRINLTLPQARVSEKIVKSTNPPKNIVQQLLILEDMIRDMLGDKKYLTPMVTVSNVVSGPRIACQLNTQRTDLFPLDETGSVNATLIGIKISGQFVTVLWRTNSFDPEPDYATCRIRDDHQNFEMEDNIDVEQSTLVEMKQSLVDEFQSATVNHEIRSNRLMEVKVLLDRVQITPLDLEKTRILLDDMENFVATYKI